MVRIGVLPKYRRIAETLLVAYRLPMRIEVYEDDEGRRPFEEWFNTLPPDHATKVLVALGRIEAGLTGSLKSVGQGVLEWRIDWGPGLRLYMAFDGSRLVLLLAGGTKRRQQADIRAAHARWADYQKRRQPRRK
jgi:putative addiction module killer protein